MASVLSALAVIDEPEKVPVCPVMIIFGDDAFLSSETWNVLQKTLLDGEDAEFSLTVLDGADTDFKTVRSELATRAMFGSGLRVVRITGADRFLSAYGADLEDYLDKPSAGSVLLLQTAVCAANTRIYKKTLAAGLLIDAKTPPAGMLAPWLVKRAQSKHQIKLKPDAAALLIDLIGTETGLLDNELARLALSVSPGEPLTAAVISEKVGAWRLRKVWDMVDAFLMGQVAEGLRQLDLLIASGENPVGILAQAATTCRRFAAATRLFLETEKSGRRADIRRILQEAKIPPFAVDKSVQQMIKLGRFRGDELVEKLMETDLALKGNSRSDARVILEQFFIWLGHAGLKASRSYRDPS